MHEGSGMGQWEGRGDREAGREGGREGGGVRRRAGRGEKNEIVLAVLQLMRVTTNTRQRYHDMLL